MLSDVTSPLVGYRFLTSLYHVGNVLLYSGAGMALLCRLLSDEQHTHGGEQEEKSGYGKDQLVACSDLPGPSSHSNH